MTDIPIPEMTFEQAMAELERVVAMMEKGDVALEKSIDLYERGAALKKHCEDKLRAAEERVSQLTLCADGTVTGAVPFNAG